MASLTATGDHAPGRAAERAAWIFYAIAALGSSIGQIWVGVDNPPWPGAVPWWVRALLVAPFAIVIDLGGVVTSGFADSRQRLGENAYGWRILSATSVALAVGINLVGHAGTPYLAVVFASLGVFAYAVWLLHTSARRRDALRATGKLAETPPSYGLRQWIREPEVTARAKLLAITSGLAVHASLTEAREQLRTERRRAALASHIDKMIQARHKDEPLLAAIAATTTPVDEVADALMAMIDVDGWARAIAELIQPPDSDPPAAGLRQDAPDTARPHIPTQQPTYDRWREIWQAINTGANPPNKAVARKAGVSRRTVQRIRNAGNAGLLDSPEPPVTRSASLASSNGHQPTLTAAS
jgi:hypothetical protein